MNIKTNGEYNKVQINFSEDKTGNGEIIKQSLMLNIREDSVQKACQLYKELKASIDRKPGTKENGEEIPACPECGRPMLLRKNGQKGNFFWGCAGFPKCKGTKQYQDKREILSEELEVIEV